MTIEKALENLHWTFTERTGFKPTQTDLDSYNTIAEFCSDKLKQQLNDNQLFGKLYIHMYMKFCIYYRCTPDNPIVQKELHKLLDKDLRWMVQEFADQINLDEMARWIDQGKDIKNYKKIQYDECAENLRILVNGALNTFNPKP